MFYLNDTSANSLLPLNNSIENEEIALTTTEEISNEISKLASKKTTGFDLITTEVLQNLPYKIVEYITILFNACIRFKY